MLKASAQLPESIERSVIHVQKVDTLSDERLLDERLLDELLRA
ncbi:MAG: hypothetical protein AAF411_28305 [Myxococcota bacterium]